MGTVSWHTSYILENLNTFLNITCMNKFLFIFVQQGVINIIRILNPRICDFKIIFVFIFILQNKYSLHTGSNLPRASYFSSQYFLGPTIKHSFAQGLLLPSSILTKASQLHKTSLWASCYLAPLYIPPPSIQLDLTQSLLAPTKQLHPTQGFNFLALSCLVPPPSQLNSNQCLLLPSPIVPRASYLLAPSPRPPTSQLHPT